MSGTAEKIWVRDPVKVWRLAYVVRSAENDDGVVIENRDETQEEVKLKDTLVWDKSHEDDSLDDVYQLGNMNEAGLLWLLQQRSVKEIVYTYIGSILLSVNPYKIVKKDDSEKFLRQVAEKAHRDLLKNGFKGRSQSVLINGESGAGKTEASKRVMSYLAIMSAERRGQGKPRGSFRGIVPGIFGKRGMPASLANLRKPSNADRAADANSGGAKAPGGEREKTTLETSILETNPVLEAFGNACTIRNDNSSRFGKFVRLEYNKSGVIDGANTMHFLLEKSRLVTQAIGERNYHIFYQFCQGAKEKLLPDDLSVGAWSDYRWLANGDIVPAAEDLENFKRLLLAFELLGFTEAELANIWKTLIGILLLGNIGFEVVPQAGGVRCVNVDEILPGLLGVKRQALEDALVRRSVRAGRRKSVSIVPLKKEEAEKSRDALGKALYASVFDWLIRRVNVATKVDPYAPKKKEKGTLFIGILDIFGFEILEHNSFEQLCINFANEKLQSMFDRTVFELERESLREEGVEPPQLQFRDNADLLQLLDSKPGGVFQLLDEQGAIGTRGSDEMFLRGLNSFHGSGQNSRYKPGNFGDSFEITHFAGPVTYMIKDLVSKNSDHLQPDLLSLIVDSKETTNPFPKELLMPSDLVKERPKKEKQVKVTQRSAAEKAIEELDEVNSKKMANLESVSSRFRQQMNNLADLLGATDLHFVRCIKPNETKAPPVFDWDPKLVLKQLKMLGVLEMVQVRKQGYPVRIAYAKFLERYPFIIKSNMMKWDKGVNDRPLVVELLSKILGEESKGKEWRTGDNKVFLVEGILDDLDREERNRREMNSSSVEMLEARREARAKDKEREKEAEAVIAAAAKAEEESKAKVEATAE